MYLTDDQEDLLDAAADNNMRRVNALLKKGIDPDFADAYRGSPLSQAISNDNLAMIKALVAAGADVNRSANSWENPIDVADSGGNAKIIDYLESQNAQSAKIKRLSRQQQALLDAVEESDTRKLHALLDKGVDPDFADSDEMTPLDVAIQHGSQVAVRALIDAGADVNRLNSFSEAPLDVARDAGHTVIAKMLEAEGAVTGKAQKKTAGRASAKSARGRPSGYREDDDYYDDDKYYFGADEGAGRKKPQASKKTAAAQTPPAPPKPVKPVFREDTLKDIFNAKNWVGKTEEMEQLWNEVPKRLQKHFDIAASLAEARRETLKQNMPKKLALKNPQPNHLPKPVAQPAPEAAVTEAPKPQPPKPGV